MILLLAELEADYQARERGGGRWGLSPLLIFD